ncbi:MAG: hypothetical protein M1829_003486 [Trizodia sp. TS-e1964]|nr:MAG: hypothetical protein M1829_003486 [Trizodia sp. TS-e1964]
MVFRSRNPFLFTPWPVTAITSLVVAVVFVPLLIVHLIVPSAPSDPIAVRGVNSSEALEDLQFLTNGFHPYNSRRNDIIRNWLLGRITAILEDNNVNFSTVDRVARDTPFHQRRRLDAIPHVTIFDDNVSNVTFSAPGPSRAPGQSVYFEGTNIIVYIRGTEDDDADWWNFQDGEEFARRPKGIGGILVNAHYDSVSTGFGATDDGVGVVTILQLIKYFTTIGNAPRRGIVALLNNGEEDFLNGATAFTQHPISKFAHVFLNLEGAGAGGRATLFRSTDSEVTSFYGKSEHPFGSVFSADGFKRGLVRSQTDYVIFQGVLGLRGLDIAFMEPRARYHTDQDDVRHTSIDSLWHMLSASISTVQSLATDTSSIFDGPNDESRKDKLKLETGTGSEGVWFDLFGKKFAVVRLHTLFAISLTLLITAPLILIAIAILLHRNDKLYLFSSLAYKTIHPEDDPIALNGWKGFSRFPLALTVASSTVIGLAFLINKINPMIIYSSQYAVWSMMLCSWFSISWFLLSGADWARPSALHRAYAFLWIFVGEWIVLIAVAFSQDRMGIAGGYFVVFYFAAIFVATLITLLELFALPRKSDYANTIHEHSGFATPGSRCDSGSAVAHSLDEGHHHQRDSDAYHEGHEDANEATPLFLSHRRTTFARYRSGGDERSIEEIYHNTNLPYGFEQSWSGRLPKWAWLLQLIFAWPFPAILVGQIALLLTSAMAQTPADGNPALLVYVAIGLFSIMILTPLGPFIHRFTSHLPTLLFLIFLGTLVYNLLAFPFSSNNRLKVFFVQKIDLDTGINQVSLTGVQPYVRDIIDFIPSSGDQGIYCSKNESLKLGLSRCSWKGLAPKVVGDISGSSDTPYSDWLEFNMTRISGLNEAVFHLFGRNSRACKLVFDSPISDFRVDDSSLDKRFDTVPEEGSKEIRLWRRQWESPWNLTVRWPVPEGHSPGEDGISGRVVCLWSDDNENGLIPALDEVRRYVPDWVAISKLADGLVEGSKAFAITS